MLQKLQEIQDMAKAIGAERDALRARVVELESKLLDFGTGCGCPCCYVAQSKAESIAKK